VGSFLLSSSFLDLVRPDNSVHLGHILLDIAPIALNKTARHHETLRVADLLVFGHLQNRVNRFPFGRIDKTAGIDDQNICLIGMGRQFVAMGGEFAHHDFTVDEILGATEADETDFQGEFFLSGELYS
jgi:hypothetical protein